MTRGQIYGVVDHCVFDERGRSLTFQVYHDGWGGQTHGDGSWADDTDFGSEKFLFIEDNTFRNAKGYKAMASIPMVAADMSPATTTWLIPQ